MLRRQRAEHCPSGRIVGVRIGWGDEWVREPGGGLLGTYARGWRRSSIERGDRWLFLGCQIGRMKLGGHDLGFRGGRGGWRGR